MASDGPGKKEASKARSGLGMEKKEKAIASGSQLPRCRYADSDGHCDEPFCPAHPGREGSAKFDPLTGELSEIEWGDNPIAWFDRRELLAQKFAEDIYELEKAAQP